MSIEVGQVFKRAYKGNLTQEKFDRIKGCKVKVDRIVNRHIYFSSIDNRALPNNVYIAYFKEVFIRADMIYLGGE